MSITQLHDPSFFTDLVSLLSGQLILPGDGAYEQACQLWNGKINIHPAAFVRCANAQDVMHTVRWTRSHHLPLSILGGGNDFAGRALYENGIVIDCSQMRAVTIDTVARTAHVQGGANAGDLIDAMQKEGLATTTGYCLTGMAGFMLGGGYGPLIGVYGLAVDNLLSAQVVMSRPV